MLTSLRRVGDAHRLRKFVGKARLTNTTPGWHCGLVLLTLFSPLNADDKSLKLYEFREMHLGVPVDIRVYATEEPSANAARRAAYERIDALNKIFSDYYAESESQRLVKSDQPIKVSEELYFLVDQSLAISRQTEGAFDITVAPLIKQWRRARRMKQLPSPEQIAAAKRLIGYEKLTLSAGEHTIQVRQPGLQLDFGGIAKGYMAEEAYKVLEHHGCPRSLVSIAGDIFAGDPPPDEPQGWKVGIAPLEKPDGPPSRYLALKRQAVSTSGDAFQYVEIDGVRYSHIVDPQTGLGLTQRGSVTVIAPRGWMADGYATAVCLLGAERGLKLMEEIDETETLIMLQTDGAALNEMQSTRFADRLWK